MRTSLDLGEFRIFNVERSEAPKEQGGFGHKLDLWTPAEWGNALAGETGELCNLLKKIRRGDIVNPLEVEDECCDVLSYLDLTAASVNIDLAKAVIRKWDYVSMSRGYEKLLVTRKYRG